MICGREVAISDMVFASRRRCVQNYALFHVKRLFYNGLSAIFCVLFGLSCGLPITVCAFVSGMCHKYFAFLSNILDVLTVFCPFWVYCGSFGGDLGSEHYFLA